MIVTREQLVELVRADRQAGRTIAFANGCFDLLHVGHIRYLQAAAAEADRLIVAVNDDEVAAGKGTGRPIMTATDRAAGNPHLAGPLGFGTPTLIVDGERWNGNEMSFQDFVESKLAG